MAINVLYNSTDTLQKKYQKSICDLSPVATDENIKTFVQGLNALSTNTITGMRKVEITDLLNDTRLDRNLRLTRTTGGTEETVSTIPFADIEDETNIGQKDLKIKGEGTFTAADIIVTKNIAGAAYIFTDWYEVGTSGVKFSTHKYQDDESTVSTGTITISLPGTDTYKPASFTLTITAN